jgi:hypothetical protein
LTLRAAERKEYYMIHESKILEMTEMNNIELAKELKEIDSAELIQALIGLNDSLIHNKMVDKIGQILGEDYKNFIIKGIEFRKRNE